MNPHPLNRAYARRDARRSPSGALGQVARWLGRVAVVAAGVLVGVGAGAADGRGQGVAGTERGASLGWVHEAWTVEDGLPVNAINGLIQSRSGYIWIATYDGLVRFDGVRFTTFNSANSDGLPSDRIVEIVESRDGALWLRTEQFHLVRFADGRFTHIDSLRGLVGDVVSLHEDATGLLWVGTNRAVGVVRDARFEPRLSLARAAQAIVVRRDGSAWVATRGTGLYRIVDGRGTRVEGPAGLAPALVWSLHEDASGRLWAGTSEGVWTAAGDGPVVRVPGTPLLDVQRFVHSPRTGEVVAYGHAGVFRMTPAGSVAIDARPRLLAAAQPIEFDTSGVLWHATGPAIFRNGELVDSLPPQAGSDGSMTATALLVDREGSVWSGSTRGAGLHRIKRGLFTVYSAREGLAGRNVYPVHEDRSGAIWVGTLSDGLSRIGADGRLTSYGVDGGFPASIATLHSDRDDRLWVGSSTGLLSCTLPSMRCTPVQSPPFGEHQVVALHADAAGRLWAGTTGGLFVRRGDRWVVPEGWTVRSQIRAMHDTRDGALWVATNGGGLVRYRNGAFVRLTTADGLPSDIIRSLHEDRDGWLWVGTEGRGLARVDPRGWANGPPSRQSSGAAPARRIVHVRVADGLFDGVIHRILEDDQQRLWMSSNRGIFWVARAELHDFAEGRRARVYSTSYGERDGLRNREANGGFHPAGVRARDGRLWFPTQDGVAVIDPALVQRDRVAPPVVVEAIITTGRTLVAGGAERLTLEAAERDLEISYTALSFLEPGNVRFRYRLDPYDTRWVDAGNRRTAFYTRVPPGDYTFRVEASDAGAAWTEQAATVALTVAPYFRETLAARFLLALCLTIAAVAAYHWRLRLLHRRTTALGALVQERTAELRANERQLEAQNAKLAELHQLRSRLFANLSHEFRTPLTLILGPLRGLLDGRHGPLQATAREQHELMLRNGQRLLRLINQILDLTRLQSGAVALERRTIDLVAFARSATIAFAPLAERQGLALTFSSSYPSLSIAVDPEQLEKVLLNLLSNALKFTPRGGTVELAVEATDDVAEVAVRDSGVGIAASELSRVFDRFYQADSSATRRYEGTGIGLALARELVELHEGTIAVESTPGAGSCFTVRLPRGGAPRLPRLTPAGRHASAEHAVIPASAAAAVVVTGEREVSPDEVRVADADDVADRTTVLVVDDNPDVRAYVRSILAATYEVIEAADGQAGLEAARAALPDLIVADVMMPELDGLALARALTSDPMTDAIPVVLLTARAAPEDHVAGLATGADAYLVKPFDPGVLEACVAGLLAGRRRLRERFQAGEATIACPAPTEVTAPSALMLRLRVLVEARLTEPNFGPEALAAAAALSYHQLYRALREEVGMTPSRFIRGVRAECASALLRVGEGSVTEVAYSVGFESLSYFNRAFRERFGEAPSAHLGAK